MTGNASTTASNPIHNCVDNAQIVEAMNAQTKAIIAAQQNASHDSAVHLARILKEDKATAAL